MLRSGSANASGRPVIAVTSGEPAGIGPDICMALARRELAADIVVLADRGMLGERARALGLEPLASCYIPGGAVPRGVSVLHVAVRRPVRAGKPDPANSPYVLELLDRATAGCMTGEFSAMTTAPVNKAVINDAGIPFSGHTEYLAGCAGVALPVMMLVGGGMRVALVTTHLPLAQVPAAITRERVGGTLRILAAALTSRFGVSRPRILVAGLNPHAGDGGYLGGEDSAVIAPALAEARNAGIDAIGPLPADTLFNPRNLAGADAVLAMYHDQGLPVLKYASFGEGVNITLGLPFVRTSVDHGTAIELAATGRAESGSLLAAVEHAVALVAVRPGAH